MTRDRHCIGLTGWNQALRAKLARGVAGDAGTAMLRPKIGPIMLRGRIGGFLAGQPDEFTPDVPQNSMEAANQKRLRAASALNPCMMPFCSVCCSVWTSWKRPNRFQARPRAITAQTQRAGGAN